MGKRLTVPKGTRYGKVTVVRELTKTDSQGRFTELRYFLCSCKCGNKVKLKLNYLTGSNMPHCGCLREKLSGKGGRNSRKHGYTKHPLYSVWRQMKFRCHDPEHNDYMHYGKRGITVCKEWRGDDPTAFVEWGIANGWGKGLQLDRINNDKGYSPKNCRFVTSKVNNNNRRSNAIVKLPRKLGGSMTFQQACEVFAKINRQTVYSRYFHSGWPILDALTKPVKQIKTRRAY